MIAKFMIEMAKLDRDMTVGNAQFWTDIVKKAEKLKKLYLVYAIIVIISKLISLITHIIFQAIGTGIVLTLAIPMLIEFYLTKGEASDYLIQVMRIYDEKDEELDAIDK